MARMERIREMVQGRPGPDYWDRKEAAGWRLAAVEWVREVPGAGEAPEFQEVPYGLQVAADCAHLEENRSESQALLLMLDLIGQDEKLSKVAEELNRQGFRTRRGTKWGIETVFQMLPRLIEVAPRMMNTPQWAARRA